MKKLSLLLATAMISLSLAACGNDKAVQENTQEVVAQQEEKVEEVSQTQDETKPEEVTEVQEAETDSFLVTYPVTVVDQAGREVVIEEEPKTLISSYVISTSLLLALDLKDELVGIEAKANTRPLYQFGAKELIDLPTVGTVKELDLEVCATLKPDLAVLPLKLKDSAATLEELGIKTILVNPESEELLLEMVDIISTATNTKEKAQELTSYIDDIKKMLEEKTAGVSEKKVYIASNSSFLSTAGSKMYQSGLISRAGGKNVADEIEDTYWAETSYEQILAWNPEYIILTADAKYTVEEVMEDPAIATCDAVVNGNVYKMPYDVESWDTPVPSGVLGSVWLSSVLYPDVISEEARENIIEEYYEKFYNFKLSEKQ